MTAPKRRTQIAATTTVMAAVTFLAAAPATAEGGDGVDVVNTETVSVYLSPTGKVETQRVYEQLALTGSGKVSFANPISTNGLRNLDGFSGVEVEDGEQLVSTTVDGEQTLRSVSEFTGDLPLDVSVTYKLDGKTVKPGDVVGESGKLEVLYRVVNTTSAEQEVTFDDGKGGTITKTVEVPIPMVGSLTTTAPSTFTNVASDQANMAGDGKGGTKLSFTMTLFPPIGSTEASFGYTADITDGVVPRADISALPVNPLESPTFKSAANSYQGGADTGIRLTDGATQIDTNLLKLRDGASDLLAGLIQLNDGAVELNAGLAGEAAPGSRQLADGAGELDAGLGKLDDGARQLAGGTGLLSDGTKTLQAGTQKLRAGTGELRAGAGDLDAGANQLDAGAIQLADGLQQAGEKAPALLGGLQEVRAGLVKVDAGLTTLATTLGPKVKQTGGFQQLAGGVQLMIDRIGSVGQPGNTLLYGLDQLRLKLQSQAVPGLNQMLNGATCASFTLDMLRTGNVVQAHPCFGQLSEQAQGAIKAGALGGAEANPLRAALLDGVASKVNGPGSAEDPTIRYGLNSLLTDLTRQDATRQNPGAIQALAMLECGVSNQALPVCDAGTLGLLQGLQGVRQGIPALVDGIAASVGAAVGDADDTAKDETLRGGVHSLIGGVDQLSDGGDELLNGLGLLSAGAGELAAGTGSLAEGTGRLAAGTRDLADGAGQLDAGAGDLADGATELDAGANKLAAGTGTAREGSGKLAAGAGDLADGLQDAADGSGLLADGLTTAREGAPQLVDGAQRLSDEGTKQLVGAGEATAQSYGEMVAVMNAGAERAQTEDMAYGAPEDAVGLTAYSFVLQGEDGEGGRNMTRGLVGLALLSAGGAVLALRRRFI